MRSLYFVSLYCKWDLNFFWLTTYFEQGHSLILLKFTIKQLDMKKVFFICGSVTEERQRKIVLTQNLAQVTKGCTKISLSEKILNIPRSFALFSIALPFDVLIKFIICRN